MEYNVAETVHHMDFQVRSAPDFQLASSVNMRIRSFVNIS